MNDQVAQVAVFFLYILMGFFVARAVISWMPTSRNHPLVRLVNDVTEPLMEPVRRILPRTGMVDLSGLVIIIVLQIVVVLVQRAADQ